MSEIPVAVMWDSRNEKLSVHPEMVILATKEHDTALWVLLSDDTGVDLEVTFDDDPPKGPFKDLGLRGKEVRGRNLTSGKKTYKYTVKVSKNGRLIKDVDPGLRKQPNP